MAGIPRMAGAKRPRRIVTPLLAVAAAALVWLVIAMTGTANSGGTYAAWNSSVQLQAASLKTGSASLQLSGFDQLSHQFTSSSLSWEEPVTIANTGSAPLSYLSAKTSVPSSTLASALAVSIWPLPAGATSCAAPVSPATGTWGAMPTNWLAGQSTIAANARATYCVLTSISSSDLAAIPGSALSPTIQISAATSTNGTGWTAGPISAPAFTFSTAAAAPWQTVTNIGTIGITPVTNGNLNVTAQEQVSPGLACVRISVVSTDKGKSQDSWQFTIDTTAAPFSGSPLGDWDWAPTQLTGYVTGKITSGPTNGLINVGGISNGSLTFNAGPPPAGGTVNNTPINGDETAVVTLCIPQSNG